MGCIEESDVLNFDLYVLFTAHNYCDLFPTDKRRVEYQTVLAYTFTYIAYLHKITNNNK